MKLFITFGQDHIHEVNGRTFDCNCVAEIECINYANGRSKAFEFFGPKFYTSYIEIDLTHEFMSHFRRGVISVEDGLMKKETTFIRATVKILAGDRFVNNFMVAADLGLVRTGTEKILTIDYKPDEVVNRYRVSKTLDKMIDASKSESTAFIILSYEIIGLEHVTE